jgi:chaperonin cofactor prefoldin
MSDEEDMLIFTDSGDITFNIPEEQTIEGVNKRLDAIEARLNILKPDPEMLEKYELLQNLYEQYKTAEALLKNSNTL